MKTIYRYMLINSLSVPQDIVGWQTLPISLYRYLTQLAIWTVRFYVNKVYRFIYSMFSKALRFGRLIVELARSWN